MRKFTWLTLALLLALPAVGGCVHSDGRASVFSGAYWEMHYNKIGEDLHGFRVDLDRAVFDLEEVPVELDD
ncbi:MAG: hypothetical protein AAF581_20585 [Planctomycetota bacterium]